MTEPKPMTMSFRLSTAKEILMEAVGPTRAEILDAGSNHNYDCRCHWCLKWWANMGPEEVDEGKYHFGPFTQEEVTEAALELHIEPWWSKEQ